MLAKVLKKFKSYKLTLKTKKAANAYNEAYILDIYQFREL